MKRAEERHDPVIESIKLLTEMLQRNNKRFERTEPKQSYADTRLSALADAQNKTEEAIAKLKEQLDRLAATIERHIKEDY